MAHVVGVPRRDPCLKCQLPVFLAERLAVGKSIYHRTCLKCARCGSQLTPGSFYETEVDNEYCCETCPDEEELAAAAEISLLNEFGVGNSDILRRRESSVVATAAADAANSNSLATININAAGADATGVVVGGQKNAVRSSIAERLAFFEQNKQQSTGVNSNNTLFGHKLLQKSVSDEEKRKNLLQQEAAEATATTTTAPTTSTYRSNAALSIFLNDTIDGDVNKQQNVAGQIIDEHTKSSSGSSSTTSDDDNNDELDEDDRTDSLTNDDSSTVNVPKLPTSEPPRNQEVRYTTTAALQLVGHEEKIETVTKITMPIKQSNEAITATTEEGKENAVDEKEKPTGDVVGNNLILSDADLVATKDSADSMDVTTEGTDNEKLYTGMAKNADIEEATTTERLRVVSERLQEFEETNNVNHIDEQMKVVAKEIKEDAAVEQIYEHESEKNDNYIVTEKTLDEVPKNDNEIEILTKKVDDDCDDNKQVPMEEGVEEEEQQQQMEQNSRNEVVKQPASIVIETMSKSDENGDADVEEVKKEEEAVKQQKTLPIEQNIENAAVTSIKLNPFSSDEDENDDGNVDMEKENLQHFDTKKSQRTKVQSANLNPFDSSDDEVELEKSAVNSSASNSITTPTVRVPPPRPPPPRVSQNPFGEPLTDNDNEQFQRSSSHLSSLGKKTPVPTPRTNLSQSNTSTPVLTPRHSNINNSSGTRTSTPYDEHNDSYRHSGSSQSLSATPQPMHRNNDTHGSNNSLASSAGGTVRSRKQRRAPAPPAAAFSPTAGAAPVKELFPSTEKVSSSIASTPSSSNVGSPRSSRKKRPAPAPPKPARLETQLPEITVEEVATTTTTSDSDTVIARNLTDSKNLLNYPLQSELNSKLSDEEKALLEGKQQTLLRQDSRNADSSANEAFSRRSSLRLIPLDASLLNDYDDNDAKSDDIKHQQQQQRLFTSVSSVKQQQEEETNVVYRRILVPSNIDTPTHETNPLLEHLSSISGGGVHDRQLEKLKDNKEAQNRNRQSQISASSGAEDSDSATLYNKSVHGKWKRRKGPAPALPIPPRKVLQMLPLQEIRHELEIIEVQQQGLEKQGVILEKMIRDRCEGQPQQQSVSNASDDDVDTIKTTTTVVQNPKEVEDLILQLFELVNEKNELFRRQAELMYLRRQHRLEQEQADIEYEIRVLMAQPERNKTDTDKAREEALIARLVEVVQLRNEVIECLEMDRLREAEEDLSIKQRLEQHNSKRESSDDIKKSSNAKLSKKEKKKQKEAKKFGKNKKHDADKDADETELKTDKEKLKKKKKKLLLF